MRFFLCVVGVIFVVVSILVVVVELLKILDSV